MSNESQNKPPADLIDRFRRARPMGSPDSSSPLNAPPPPDRDNTGSQPDSNRREDINRIISGNPNLTPDELRLKLAGLGYRPEDIEQHLHGRGFSRIDYSDDPDDENFIPAGGRPFVNYLNQSEGDLIEVARMLDSLPSNLRLTIEDIEAARAGGGGRPPGGGRITTYWREDPDPSNDHNDEFRRLVKEYFWKQPYEQLQEELNHWSTRGDLDSSGGEYLKLLRTVESIHNIYSGADFKGLQKHLNRLREKTDLTEDEKNQKFILEQVEGKFVEEARKKGLIQNLDESLSNILFENIEAFNSGSSLIEDKIVSEIEKAEEKEQIFGMPMYKYIQNKFSGIRQYYYMNGLMQMKNKIDKKNDIEPYRIPKILKAWNLEYVLNEKERLNKETAEKEHQKLKNEALSYFNNPYEQGEITFTGFEGKKTRLGFLIEEKSEEAFLKIYSLNTQKKNELARRSMEVFGRDGLTNEQKAEEIEKLAEEIEERYEDEIDEYKESVKKQIMEEFSEAVRGYINFIEKMVPSKVPLPLDSISGEVSRIERAVSNAISELSAKPELGIGTEEGVKLKNMIEGRLYFFAAKRCGESFRTEDMAKIMQAVGARTKDVFTAVYKDLDGYVEQQCVQLEQNNGEYYRPDTWSDEDIKELFNYFGQKHTITDQEGKTVLIDFGDIWLKQLAKEAEREYRDTLKSRGVYKKGELDREDKKQIKKNLKEKRAEYAEKLKNRVLNEMPFDDSKRMEILSALKKEQMIHSGLIQKLSASPDADVGKIRRKLEEAFTISEHILDALLISSRYGQLRINQLVKDTNGQVVMENNKPKTETRIIDDVVLEEFHRLVDANEAKLRELFTYKGSFRQELFDVVTGRVPFIDDYKILNDSNLSDEFKQKYIEENRVALRGFPMTEFYLSYDKDNRQKFFYYRDQQARITKAIPAQIAMNMQEAVWRLWHDAQSNVFKKVLETLKDEHEKNKAEDDPNYKRKSRPLSQNDRYEGVWYPGGGGFTAGRRLFDSGLLPHTMFDGVGHEYVFGERTKGRSLMYGIYEALRTFTGDTARYFGARNAAELFRRFDGEDIISPGPLQLFLQWADAEKLRKMFIGPAEVGNKVVKGLVNAPIVSPKEASLEGKETSYIADEPFNQEEKVKKLAPDKLLALMNKVFEPTMDICGVFEGYLGVGNVTGNTGTAKYARGIIFGVVFKWFLDNPPELQDKFSDYGDEFRKIIKEKHRFGKNSPIRSVVAEFVRSNSIDRPTVISVIGQKYAQEYFTQSEINEVFPQTSSTVDTGGGENNNLGNNQQNSRGGFGGLFRR